MTNDESAASDPLSLGLRHSLVIRHYSLVILQCIPSRHGQCLRAQLVQQPRGLVLVGTAPGVGVEWQFGLGDRIAHVAEAQRDQAQRFAALPRAAEKSREM